MDIKYKKYFTKSLKNKNYLLVKENEKYYNYKENKTKEINNNKFLKKFFKIKSKISKNSFRLNYNLNSNLFNKEKDKDKNKNFMKQINSLSVKLIKNNDKQNKKKIMNNISIKEHLIYKNNFNVERKKFQIKIPKFIELDNNLIKGFSANSINGLIKNYNEDEYNIIINIKKKDNYNGIWPNCSYFSIFDGHAGSNCASYLKQNLHNLIINSTFFPNNPKKALEEAFILAEKILFDKFIINKNKDYSGSCAVVLLIVNSNLYTANLGDSRAISSLNNGRIIKDLTIDHKPNTIIEKTRIQNAGGKVYKNKINSPYRLYPGGLSVSRSFGDFHSKLENFGGNPNVLISKPDINLYDLKQDYDFILLGSDGIWDKLDSSIIINYIWKKIIDLNLTQNYIPFNIFLNKIISEAMKKNSYDNITLIIIIFKKSLIN